MGIIAFNRRVSAYVDRLTPEDMRVDGNKDFNSRIAPQLVERGMKIYDLGGGSRPFLDPASKAANDITVIGLDIAAEELLSAPPGSYNDIIVADLAEFRGNGDGDLAICQATLEHVRDVTNAISGIASTLKPGGRAAIFVPCRNAAFARLNLLLPESFKRKILFSFFPEKAEGHDGFPAFYDNSTPSRMIAIADRAGMDVEQSRYYWISSYFFSVFPLYLFWRAWTRVARSVVGRDMCETFMLVLKKR